MLSIPYYAEDLFQIKIAGLTKKYHCYNLYSWAYLKLKKLKKD